MHLLSLGPRMRSRNEGNGLKTRQLSGAVVATRIFGNGALMSMVGFHFYSPTRRRTSAGR